MFLKFPSWGVAGFAWRGEMVYVTWVYVLLRHLRRHLPHLSTLGRREDSYKLSLAGEGGPRSGGCGQSYKLTSSPLENIFTN
jgi:hypothetical protein